MKRHKGINVYGLTLAGEAQLYGELPHTPNSQSRLIPSQDVSRRQLIDVFPSY